MSESTKESSGRIFLSYAKEDHDTAIWIALALREAGFETWLYEENSIPGITFIEQIHSAIVGADAFTALISVHSLVSHISLREMSLGFELGKPFMPVLIDLTHDEFMRQRPEFQLVCGVEVAAFLDANRSMNTLQEIIKGLRMQVSRSGPTNTAFARPPASKTPVPLCETPPDSPPLSAWQQMSNRVRVVKPEIEGLRLELKRTWPAAGCLRAGAKYDPALVSERVRIADQLVGELTAMARQEGHVPPAGYSIVARGGFGRGVLSIGSDIDITFIHASGEMKESEDFWRFFSQAFIDVWIAVSTTRVAPAFLELELASENWLAALDVGDLAPLCSFAYSRHLAGKSSVHARLRECWHQVIAGLSNERMIHLIRILRDRVSRYRITTDSPTFDTKKDAGGILDYRLTGFLEHMLQILYPDTVHPSYCDPEAHHFLLNLREISFTICGTHILWQDQLGRAAEILSPQFGTISSPDALIPLLIRQRRRIRGGFESALESLEELTTSRLLTTQ